MDLLKNRVEKLEQQSQVHSESTTHSHNINNNSTTNSHNTVNSHNTIIINNFGSENLSYLTPEFIENCTCIIPDGIQRMVKAIHLNMNHPENHNIKVTNIKSPVVHVIKNNEWTFKDKKDTLKILIEKTSDILKMFFDDNKKGITERWNSYKRDAIEFYHERLENEEKELWKKLMKEIFLMFCNNRKMFKTKRKRKPKQQEIINDQHMLV